MMKITGTSGDGVVTIKLYIRSIFYIGEAEYKIIYVCCKIRF